MAYGSAVLADGRVVLEGGEYDGSGNFVLSNQGAIYDPKANTWTALSPPAGWSYIGDAPTAVLPNGKLLLGSKLNQQLALLDPSTLTWTIVNPTGKIDGFNAEEDWTLLPDGSVFTLDVQSAPNSERYLPSTSTWVSAGVTPVGLASGPDEGPIQVAAGVVYVPPGEVGPAARLPNGTLFVEGGNGKNAVFTPPPANSTSPGTWGLAPAFPSGLAVDDGPSAILPSGRVLAAVSPPSSGKGLALFEFDGTNLTSVPNIPNAASDASNYVSLLLLPTGQVLLVDTSNIVEIYTPAGTYNSSWAPTVSSVPPALTSGSTYQIFGTQFNGLSQGTGSGDELENATNYPLVRIVNNASGHVFYANTHDHSTMGVATGATPVFTNFDVPANTELGASTLVVVANGIPSAPNSVTIANTTPPGVTLTCPASTTRVDVPYNSSAVAIGGQPPFTYSISTGSLPAGLNLDPNSGAITGTPGAAGASTFTIKATDSFPTPDSVTASCTITASLGPAVGFQKFDITTQGSWKGVYGQDGWIIANDTTNPPAYAVVSQTGASTWTWSPSTTDPRALQKGAVATDRIASTYYSSTSFSFDINLTDGQTHQVAFYSLDYETDARAQTVTVLDAITHAVLDTRQMSFMNSGLYAVWNLQGHVIVQVTWTAGLNAVVGGLFFSTPATGVAPPAVNITNPPAGTVSGSVTVTANATSTAASVQFQLDGTNLGTPITGTGPNYSISWSTPTAANGPHTLTAIATDSLGQHTTSSGIAVTVSNAGSGANVSFVKFDLTTLGSWKGAYGKDGYIVANDSNAPPAYATVTPSGAALYTWSGSTTDSRALQTGTSGTYRIASCYYTSNGFSFDVNLTDGQPHQVALYLLDWDTTTRAETISIKDANTGTVLDSRPATNFHTGVYGIWNVQGHVTIQVTNSGNPNAVVGGLFFGAGASAAPPPVVNMTSPVAGTISNTVMVAATASSPVGIASVQFQLDGSNLGAAIPGSGSYSIQWATGSVSNGPHTLAAIATDTEGQHTTSTAVAVTVSNIVAAPPPVVSLTSPAPGTVSNTVTLTANATSPTLAIASVQFQLDGVNFGNPVTGSGPSFSTSWATTPALNGPHTLTAIATDTQGQMTTSNSVAVTVSNAAAGGASASFVKFDTATQGSWKGVYGYDGEIIANDSNNPPGYATLSPAGAGLWTWAGSSTDPRTLQKEASSTDRIASCYFASGTFTFDLNLKDGQTHQVALYALDMDTATRAETISILDATTLSTLDSRSLSNFHNGIWIVWNLQGHVQIQVTSTGSPNGVVSGMFFGSGPPVGPPPTVAMTAPPTGLVSGTVTVSASASSPAGIASVQFQLDGANLGSAVAAPAPYSIQWSTVTAVNGPHTLTAIATDTQGQTSTSTGLAVTVSNAAPAGPVAAFVMKDNTTGGTWKGRYGLDGAIIANDSNYPPAYVTPTISGATPFTWAITQDPRALQQYAGSSRTASTFYASPGFSIDLNFTDGMAHQLALYFLDWDNSGRSETVTIVNPATQQTLNVQTISGFQQGAYLVWNITGHVTVQFVKGAGPNAVVSGVFFAPAQ